MSGIETAPYRPDRDGILLRVRVTPKSSIDAVSGLAETPEGPALQVKVRAVPADGAANTAVEKLVAKWLGTPRSAVRLQSGSKSRVKLLHVTGNASTLVEQMCDKLQGREQGR